MREGGLESWEDELLLALVRLAVGPVGDVPYRLRVLLVVADGAMQRGDRDGVEAAAQESLRLLREGNPEDLSGFKVGPHSFQLGHRAASVGLYSLAREMYEAGLASFDEGILDPGRGVLWLAVGDAWKQEGNDEQALDAYREAVTANRSISFSNRRFEGLVKLIEAEVRADQEADLDLLIDESTRVLEELQAESPEDVELFARRLGQAAEGSGHHAQARKIYTLTLGLSDGKPGRIAPAVLRQDIADTWLAEDDGVRALQAYREAAANLRLLSPAGHVILLSDLAPAELAWGTRAAAGAAVDKAAELLGKLPPSGSPAALDEALGALAELSRKLDRPDTAVRFEGQGKKEDTAVAGERVGGETL